MTRHLPGWVMKRYAKLWSKFKDKEFTKEQAAALFTNDKAISVILSELRKSGWLELKLSEKDARRTVYKLKDPAKAIIEEIKEMNKDGN